MSKSIKREKDKKKDYFSREVLGMAIILFAVLGFLCMFIGNLVYPVGEIVRSFMLGVFGYYSFVFLFLCLYFGISLVISRPLLNKNANRNFIVGNVALFAIMAVLHLAISGVARDEGFFEVVKNAYIQNGNNSLYGATVGGAFFAMILFPILSMFRVFGAYCINGIIIAICLIYFFRGKLRITEKSKLIPPRKSQVNDEPSRIDTKLTNQNTNDTYYLQNNVLSQNQNNQGQVVDMGANANNLFGNVSTPSNSVEDFNNINSNLKPEPISNERGNGLFVPDAVFERRTKKDKANEDFSVKIAFPGLGGSTSILQNDTPKRYSSAYNEDLSSKLEYIRTPLKPDLSNLGQSPMGINRTNPITTDKSVNNYYGEVQKDVYNLNGNRISQSRTLGDRVEENLSTKPISPFDETTSNNQNDTLSKVYQPTRTEISSTQPLQFKATESVNFNNDSYLNPTNVKSGMFNNSIVTEYDDAGVTDDSDTMPNYNKNDWNSNVEYNRVDKPNDFVKTVETTNKYTSENLKSEPVIPKPSFSESKVSCAINSINKASSEQNNNEEKINPIDEMPINYKYKFPPLSLLNDYSTGGVDNAEDRKLESFRINQILETMYKCKGIQGKVEQVIYGPTVSRFVISIPQGVSNKTVLSLQSDFQMWLEAKQEIRLIVPIFGTSKIGIEIPNVKRYPVGLRDIVASKTFKEASSSNTISFALGKDIVGNPIVLNLLDMPHLLVAGATGTGKSVFLNSMLVSLLYKYTPEDLRIIIVDPKMVDFEVFKGIPHLLFNDILANDGRALAMLEWATVEMDRRFLMLRAAGVKKLSEYNRKMVETNGRKLPYIIILIDEFAELMCTAQDKKRMENYVTRLAQKARASGISLVFAIQRPSADIIDGSIKANFTSRICFTMSSNVDSQVMLGESGAEKLVGKGDCLYKTTTSPHTERAQGAFIDDDAELKRVIDYVRDNNRSYYDENALEQINKTNEKYKPVENTYSSSDNENDDPDAVEDVYLRALRLVILTRNTSKNYLQTKLAVGFPKAARIIDWMEEMGYISRVVDNKSREVLITKEEYTRKYGEFVDSYK